LITSAGGEALSVGADVSLLLIEVRNHEGINRHYGPYAADELLRHVVKYARGGLRVADILFRYGSGQLIALLNRTDPTTAALIADRICANVSGHKLVLQDGAMLDVSVDVRSVASPNDGRSFGELIAALRNKPKRLVMPTPACT
jgi:diguanylate cyclase (GGDEF)-like protein